MRLEIMDDESHLDVISLVTLTDHSVYVVSIRLGLTVADM